MENEAPQGGQMQNQVSSSPQPSIPPIPVVKQAQTRNMLLLIGAIIALLGLAAAGFFAYQNIQLKQQLSQVSPTPLPLPSPTPDPTANWKTYQNSKYRFSFKYPGNLSNEGGVGGTFLGNPELLGTLSDKSTMRDGTDAPFNGFSFYRVENRESSFESFLAKEIAARDQSPRGIFSKKITKIIVSGQQSAFIDVEEPIRQYFIPTEDNNIIVFAVVRQSDDFLIVFDQILSTFTFSNQVGVSSWKTYSHSLFSIQLPPDWYQGASVNPIQYSNFISDSRGGSGYNPNVDKGKLKVEIYTIQTVKELVMYVQDQKQNSIELRGSDPKWTETIVTVAGKQAIKVKNSLPGFVVYTKPNQQTILGISFALDFDTYSDLADQILSTFKFTN